MSNRTRNLKKGYKAPREFNRSFWNAFVTEIGANDTKQLYRMYDNKIEGLQPRIRNPEYESGNGHEEYTSDFLNFYQTEGVNFLLRNRSEEHTSELQSHSDLVCRLLLEKKK